jgi:hypothetical protein
VSLRGWQDGSRPARFWSIAAGGLLLAYLCLGLAIYRHYGVSWDEHFSRMNGAVSLRYIFGLFGFAPQTGHVSIAPPIEKWSDRDYGVAFELPVATLEWALGLNDSHDVFLLRHLATFLFFTLGVLAIHATARRRFAHPATALLVAILFVVSPRIFADSFYNSKDAVLLAAYAIAIWTGVRLFLIPGVGGALAHAAATAFAMNVRIVAVYMFLITLVFLVATLIRDRKDRAQTVLLAVIYAVAAAALFIAMSPYLWEDPIWRTIQIFQNMAHFRWRGSMMFMGEFIRANALPWFYLPVYFSITTPLIALALISAGLALILVNLIKANVVLWRNNSEKLDLFFVANFLGPVVIVIVLKSHLYDGWRQMYFIYAGAILVGGYAMNLLVQAASRRRLGPLAATAGFALSISPVLHFLYVAHPIQNVYFNALAGSNLKARFDIDYWGLANRVALERILARDETPLITVKPGSFTPVILSVGFLHPEQRKRVLAKEAAEPAMYILNNYRHVTDTSDDRFLGEYAVFDRIVVGGEVILTIYRHRNPASLPSP